MFSLFWAILFIFCPQKTLCAVVSPCTPLPVLCLEAHPQRWGINTTPTGSDCMSRLLAVEAKAINHEKQTGEFKV